MRRLIQVLCSLSVLGIDLSSQSIVVPNASANTRGGAGINVLIFTSGRTWMIGIPAPELAGIPPGSVINGVSFRSSIPTGNPAMWPPVDTTFANYDVTIGYVLPLATWTTTYAANFVNTPIAPVVARAGPMVIEAGTFTNNASLPAPQPQAWAEFYWDFQKTLPYIGGDVGILFSNPGNPSGTFFLDQVPAAPTTGVGFWAAAYQATVGTNLNAITIQRIHYGYGGGCPGTGGMVPMLVQSGNVTGGGNVNFAIGNAPPGGVALYLVGARPSTVGLSNGCTLLTTPTILFPVLLNANGRNSFKATFPPGLSLQAYVQAFVIDPGALGGFSATNGVTLTVSP